MHIHRHSDRKFERATWYPKTGLRQQQSIAAAPTLEGDGFLQLEQYQWRRPRAKKRISLARVWK